MRRKEFRKKHLRQGFTLVELMVVVAVVAVLAAIAVPAFTSMVAKNKVKAAAEDVYGLVLQAKSEAPIRDADLSVSVTTGVGIAWCVGIVAATADCDCSNDTDCVLEVAGTPNVLHVVRGVDHKDIAVTAPLLGVNGPTFELPRGGVDSAGSIQLINGDWELDVEVSAEGRVKVCNPNSNTIPGYETC